MWTAWIGGGGETQVLVNIVDKAMWIDGCQLSTDVGVKSQVAGECHETRPDIRTVMLFPSVDGIKTEYTVVGFALSN